MLDPDPQGRPLALKKSLEQHPAWSDLQRRRKSGELPGAYLAAGRTPLLYLPPGSARHWQGPERVRIQAAKAYEQAEARQAGELVVLLDAQAGAAAAPAAAEGLALRAYRFDKYKKRDKKAAPKVTFVVPAKGLAGTRRAVQERLRRVASVNGARDLVNEPGSVATPAEIERRARALARRAGLKITVLQQKELERQGYRGLITVGKAAMVAPRMIVLSYRPGGGTSAGRAGPVKAGPHLGLLGKGITFDTGGISLKPSSKMWQMKGDMAGAAATLYAMEAIAAAKPARPVTGVIVTAQNAIDAKATLPGDVFKAKNGKTVHVDNTDAEGRLILTDGLWRMGEEKVTHLVDVATLTGSCMRALGTAVSGVMGNDAFADDVVEVSQAEGEPCWRLPLVEEYTELLKNEVADLNNIGSTPNAGAITAGLFLREFVPDGVHWAHVDIAGTFLAEQAWKYYRPGATGVMVRTLAALASRLAG